MNNFAVISDIHANVAAFKAVLDDINLMSPERIICLGDIVGYGPEPKKTLSMVRANCDIVIKGNHDQAAIEYPEGFNKIAHEAIVWTKRSLKSLRLFSSEVRMNWRFLQSLPELYKEDNMLFVHGSPREPVTEYIDEDDTFEIYPSGREKLKNIFTYINHICFCGHTHIPGIFTEDFEFIHPEVLNDGYTLDKKRKYIINVGSVGQPRDAFCEASYVLYRDGKINYRRVEYDVSDTYNKIISNPCLSNFLADRLHRGE